MANATIALTFHFSWLRKIEKPRLEYRRESALRAAMTPLAFQFSENSSDSAMFVTLNPGAYTFQVSGADGGTGVSLLEVYEQ